MRDLTVKNKALIIFSVFQDHGVNSLNLVEHLELERELRYFGVPHKIVHGQYKGTQELSFIIPEHLFLAYQLHERVWDRYKQESVLHLEPFDGEIYKASLIYNEGNKEFIGYYRQASKNEAEQQDGFTYCPKLNAYFIVSDTLK